MLKRLFLVLTIFNAQFSIFNLSAQDVMLQGFYWDGYSDCSWTKLEKQAETLGNYFNYVWVPNSGYCGDHNNMGYMPLYYWNQNSSFGTEAELRSMISSLKKHGVGTLADVVINHHNTDGWFGFPAETYKGETYQFQSTDICANDDGGSTKTEADKEGVSLSSNNDTGTDWGGCRDLDHTSANVNRIIKAYEDYLLNDLGYAGFRYDMVKGFAPKYIADYNTTTKPQFSVGEYWDGSTAIKSWIDGTKVDGVPTSCAFDFQFRYRVRDAITQCNFTKLAGSASDQGGYPLIYQDEYKAYAVTFVENHDTERRPSDEQDPLKADTLAANAYMLAMPGTPCVFYKHWLSKKSDIKRMISARKLAGIERTSNVEVLFSQSLCYATRTVGTNGSLICVVGKATGMYSAPADYTKVCSGLDYVYYLDNASAQGWTAVTSQIAAEEQADREEEEAEKAEEEAFVPYTITIHCKADFTPVYFYAWDTKSILNDWPGNNMEGKTKVIVGETWYCQDFTIKSKNYEVNIIFNNGSGAQTSDIKGITTDKFYTATISGGKVVYEDVTDLHTDITAPHPQPFSPEEGEGSSYDLSGRKVSFPSHGLYIRNGKKYIK